MNINLDLYKVFCVVAKNESISRGANELMISQPAISKSIKSLESQLNVKLFIRKRDGVSLTAEGEILYKKIKEAMDLITSAENDINLITTGKYGTINIGASTTIIHEFLMEYIEKFNSIYPNIEIKIHTDNIKELTKKLRNNVIDILITNSPYSFTSEFEDIKLIDLNDCFVFNKNFDYLKNKKLTIKDLEKLPLIILEKGTKTRMRLDDYCISNNIKLNPKMELHSNSLVKEFTLSGFGIGMLTKENVKKQLENKELFELNIKHNIPKTSLSLIHSKENNKIVKKLFIGMIEDEIKNEKL